MRRQEKSDDPGDCFRLRPDPRRFGGGVPGGGKGGAGEGLRGPRPHRPGGVSGSSTARSGPPFTPGPGFPGRRFWKSCSVITAGTRIPLLLERWETDYWERVKAMTRVFPEAEEVLRRAPGPGVPPGPDHQCPGTAEEGKHRLGNYPELERFFEVIVVAGEGGIPAKPDPAPFRLCLDKLGLAPGEAVYVGDDWRIDVRGSEAVGMHPVWLRSTAWCRGTGPRSKPRRRSSTAWMHCWISSADPGPVGARQRIGKQVDPIQHISDFTPNCSGKIKDR